MKLLVGKRAVLVLLLALMLLPAGAFAATDSVRLEPVGDAARGESILVRGETERPDAIVQLFRPNGTLLWMDVVERSELAIGKPVTIPADAPLGRYTLRAGSGHETAAATFLVTEGGAGNPPFVHVPDVEPEPADDRLVVAPGKPDASGVSRAMVTQAMIDKTRSENGSVVSIVVDPVEGASAYELVLPAGELSEAGEGYAFRVVTEWVWLELPRGLLPRPGPSIAMVDKVALTIKDANVTGIGRTANHRPAVDIALQLNDEQLGEFGRILAAVPYEADGEQDRLLTVSHTGRDGKTQPVVSGRYDAAANEMRFIAERPGTYEIVYRPTPFADLAGYVWAEPAIGELAARGVVNGVSDAEYAPAAPIKRADYVLLLMRLLALESPAGSAVSGFEDVKPGSYYEEAVGTAKALGITQGSGGNRFLPDKEITRQEMTTLTAKALKLAGILDASPGASVVTAFQDEERIAPYAKESVTLLAASGLIVGDDGMLNPDRHTSRAEAAVLMQRVYRLIYP
ncbi:S-layer homology domain-containing protein [Paenibacillus soyae]|uniref:S-layer homology domain-containing protein n=1 Tax=Paenibacillus soyae TaxID=2969249 RepID=A0A9X2MUT8_9BACL|nr:S-layer homology domain-containing protein [Paenibacillus soyae]MCR2807294.1 S-layer homology domain-containing protein [Paenibacillus soyae]